MSRRQSDGGWTSFDWDAVRSSLRRHLAGRSDALRGAELDDLVQEGCVRLMRAHRRTPIEDQEAMVTVIARRTFYDWLRRQYRHERLWDPLHEAAEVAAPAARDPQYGDLVERIEFLVTQMFRRAKRDECLELAGAWFARRNWKDVATQLDVSHATVRKRWSRCLDLARQELSSDPEYGHLFAGGES